MAAKTKSSRKPINYFYNPYYKNEQELSFLEVWQVLDDDVLGTLYPWQYIATAETSDRIVALNFYALKYFEKDYVKYPNQTFVYKVSARLLKEGNVHRLGSLLRPNLILCFDVYQLEKFGDKEALAGLTYLKNLGATLMVDGVDRAPVDVLMKYPVEYFLLDYRYYRPDNRGVIAMIKQLADTNNVTLAIGNVVDRNNLSLFESAGIEIYAGPALNKARKKIDALIKTVDDVKEVDIVPVEKGAIVEPSLLDTEDKKIKKKFLVQATETKPDDGSLYVKKENEVTNIVVEAPIIKELQQLQKEQEEEAKAQERKDSLVKAPAPRPNAKPAKKVEENLKPSEKPAKEMKAPKKQGKNVSKNAAIVRAAVPRPNKK